MGARTFEPAMSDGGSVGLPEGLTIELPTGRPADAESQLTPQRRGSGDAGPGPGSGGWAAAGLLLRHRRWRRFVSWWSALLASPYVRRACQCSLGTAAIMCICSPSAVWSAISLDPVLANPSLILVLFYMVLLVSLSTGQAPVRVAAEVLAGSVAGGAAGLAVVYFILEVNGGSYEDTVLKAVLMVLLSALILFCATVCRFCYRSHSLIFQFLSITFAINTASSYHASGSFYKFILFWLAYSCIGGLTAFLCATFVLPITAGTIVRTQLSAGLRLTAATLRQTTELITGEVAPDSGLLAAASGETAERIGLDSGLWPQLQPLYASATAAGQAIQTAYRHLDSAPLQLDVYRRQRRFPARPFSLLTILSRSFLNATMIVVYPAQTGTMHCLLLARHRQQLLALAAAIEECCAALGDALVQNAPVSAVLERLAAVEARYAALAVASRFKGSKLSQDAVALDTVLSLLFTACTRLRRMAVLLPEALGRDQPSSLQPVLDHFLPELQGEGQAPGAVPAANANAAKGEDGAGVRWDFARLTQIPLQGQEANPIELLRSALLAAQPRRSSSTGALQTLLAEPEVVCLPRPSPPQGRWHGFLAWLKARTGIAPEHLALGCQMVAAYVPVLVMLIIPQVNAAFNHNLPWALFVIVSVLEPSTGAAIFKGLQRLAGTLLACGLGVSAQYLVYALNGMSYANGVGKFAAMAVVLSLMAGGLAAAGVKFARFSYLFIIANVVLALTALPGFQTGHTMPIVALWRTIVTALGVAVEVVAVSVVLPVTARHIFRLTMAATLDKMAVVARTAFSSWLPKPHRSRSSKRQLAEGSAQQQQQPGAARPEQQVKPVQASAHAQGPNGRAGFLPRLPLEQAGLSASPTAQQQQLAGLARQQTQARQQQERQQQPQQQNRQQQQHQALQDEDYVAIDVPGGQQIQLHRIRTGGVQYGSAQLEDLLGQGHEQQQAQQQGRRRSSDGDAALVTPLSPPGSASLSCRRRGRATPGRPSLEGRRCGAWEDRPVSIAVAGGSPTSEDCTAMSPRSDVSGRMSILATVGKRATFKIIGTVYARLLPDAFSASGSIVTMLQLNHALHFEYYTFSWMHRFPFDHGFRAQRLCRHMLNIIAGAVIVLDSHEVVGLPLLAPFAGRLERTIEQLAACLEGLATFVRGEHPYDRAVPTVLALEEHVQRLFLLVLSQELPPDLSEADVINGLALLSVLINASYVARLLALALVKTFAVSEEAAAAEASLLEKGRATRWAADDRALQLGMGILGVALGAGSTSAASASGGGLTPRWAPALAREAGVGAGVGAGGGASPGQQASPRSD